MSVRYFLLSLLISTHCFAWEVVSKKGHFYLQEGQDSYQVTSEGGAPKFLKTENWERGLKKIIYYAGSAGTSQICEITRALVVNKDKKVLGDLPISYKCGELLEEAQWVLKQGIIEVTDPQTDELIKVIIR